MRYKLRKIFSNDANECVEDILKNRGVEDVDEFLHPTLDCELDYNCLDNIHNGVKMLLKHIRNNSKIGLVVDSDVDGITSSSIMYMYIKDIDPKANIWYFVHDGKKHGLEDIVKDFMDDEPYDLIIVPDAGSNDIKQMNMLKEMGTDVLVIDHHECEFEGYDCIPSNTVLINNQQSKNYENKQLCGAGMVYKFFQAVDDELDIKNAFNYIDLVALGEIADSMMKTNTEANYLMTAGLKNIKNECFKTLLAAQNFKLGEKAFYPYHGLTTQDVAFYIAPLLNAIVRVGTIEENEKVIQAFIDPKKIVPSTKKGSFGETETISEQIARLGTNCRSRQNRIKDKAIEYIDFKIRDEGLDDDNVIVVQLNHDEVDFPNSLTGLIAANEVSKYNRPVLIGWEGPDGKMLKGSIRGNENFEALPDLKEYLTKSGYFESVMGHSNAAGFAIPLKNIDNFVDFANKNLNSNSFNNCYLVDYIFNANDYELFQVGYEIASHPEYFGNGIDEVKFIVKGIPINDIMVMGANKSHCKITHNNMEFVKFNDYDFIDDLNNARGKTVDILCRFNLNFFQGSVTLQGMIDDYEITSAASSKYDF